MKILKKDPRLEPFVKEVFLFQDSGPEHFLPFYADGYPGIVYTESCNGVFHIPLHKKLSDFFLYGQTIEPIELNIKGPYKMLVFQLYPFATRLLLEMDPKKINDDCFDLRQHQSMYNSNLLEILKSSATEKQTEVITSYIMDLVKMSASNPDHTIKMAVSTMILSKGSIPIHQLREQLFISERTFERRFAREIGVTAKQFCKIVQFSFSFHQLQESEYTTLTNVAYDNGYSDQSHFIRAFKAHTGFTPREILSRIS